jgi:hypothetical protein
MKDVLLGTSNLGENRAVEEIRISPNYANLIISTFEGTKEDDSTPAIKRKTIFTKDYISKLNESNKLFTGNVMPPNCRYIEPINRGVIAVIEEPPSFRTIFVDRDLREEFNVLSKQGRLDEYEIPKNFLEKNRQPYYLNLAIPYTIFLMWITEYFSVGITEVYFRTNQLMGLSDNLLLAPFLNIPTEQRICYQSGNKCISLTAAIQQGIKAFWESTFNSDYTHNYESYKETPVVGNYLEWQAMSKINPLFIYNADWQVRPYNLGQRINNLIEQAGGRSKNKFGYAELADLFYSRLDSGVDIKPSPRSKNKYRLFFDIANSLYLDDILHIEVGDTFKTHDGKIAYIDSLAGFSDGSEIKYIQIDINGKKHLMKYTKECKKFLFDKVKEDRFAKEYTLSNGQVIKEGDILIIKPTKSMEIFRRVEYIRKSRGLEEDAEIRVGRNYYLASRLKAEKLDADEPIYKGVKLIKDKEYIISTGGGGIFSEGYRCKFEKLDAHRDSLVASFIQSGGRRRTLNLSVPRQTQLAYPLDQTKPLKTGISKIGRKVFTVTKNGSHPSKEGMWQVGPSLIFDGSYAVNALTVGDFIKELYDDDKFHISGVDFDIDFAIGEKVVVANWEDPLSVLSVKTIQGFKETDNHFDFVLSDKAGNLTTEQFIDPQSNIYSGKIRKVTNKWGRLSVGTKIIADVPGIPNFPKKDVNIIVAFIIDIPDEPLVLCSNGCTLWYNDVVEKFKKIKMGSKQWEKLQHVPLDLSKIKFQAGDVVNGFSDFRESGGYLLYDPSPTRSLKAMPMNVMHIGDEGYHYVADKYFMNDMIFDCIPAPRVATTKVADSDIVKGYLNINSYQIEEDDSSIFSFLKPKEN